MKEEDIVYENNEWWVGKNKKDYTVYKNCITNSTSVVTFDKTEDGLSLAKAYCCYKSKGGWVWHG